MTNPAEIARDLRAYLAVCEELLLLVERENELLRTHQSPPIAEFAQRRKTLLPQLEQSLAQLKHHRLNWQRLRAEEREHTPEVASLIRLNQDLIMRVMMLDRENEQLLLRHGLVAPPAPVPAPPQPLHFVAELYRRHSPQ
jgi:hypothetical protein